MKYILVCKNEPRESGYRAADVFDTIPWEPNQEQLWVECDDTTTIDSKWYDPTDNTLKDYPVYVKASATQPTTTGITEL